MARVVDRMESLLVEAFQPQELSIVDDSGKHAGHAGARAQGESHFSLRIVSEAFSGKSRVARHQMVYAALKPLFDEGLHALAIEAKAVGER